MVGNDQKGNTVGKKVQIVYRFYSFIVKQTEKQRILFDWNTKLLKLKTKKNNHPFPLCFELGIGTYVHHTKD